MDSKKLLLLPSNQTALHGMVQLYKEAEKRAVSANYSSNQESNLMEITMS